VFCARVLLFTVFVNLTVHSLLRQTCYLCRVSSVTEEHLTPLTHARHTWGALGPVVKLDKLGVAWVVPPSDQLAPMRHVLDACTCGSVPGQCTAAVPQGYIQRKLCMNQTWCSYICTWHSHSQHWIQSTTLNHASPEHQGGS
jgi:hypothetical protein